MSKKVAVFAGQGAQAPGMGKDLALEFSECASLFNEADDILGFKLSDICFNGPAEELTKTNICQPAIFVMSAACYTALKLVKPEVSFDAVAGLSLGEWTALWASGAISFADTVKVLEARGRYMQEACEAEATGMLSVLRVSAEVAEKVAAETGCSVSNYNTAEQTVISGTVEQIKAAEAAAAAAGARAVVLQVAGAYHSKYMTPAAEKLAEVLANASIKAPAVPVMSNFTGKYHGSVEEIKQAMLNQICGSVRWQQNIEALAADGADKFVEFGPGKVLTGLIKRIVTPAPVLINVGSVDQVKAAAEAL